jgi:hypothetical protein
MTLAMAILLALAPVLAWYLMDRLDMAMKNMVGAVAGLWLVLCSAIGVVWFFAWIGLVK